MAEAKAVVNGDSAAVAPSGGGAAAEAVARLTQELEEARRRTSQRDEEVKLYRGKLEESNKQMALLVSATVESGQTHWEHSF